MEESEMRKCEVCEGKGVIPSTRFEERKFADEEFCPVCNGSGMIKGLVKQ